MIIAKEFVFDSSHQLPNEECYGKCRFLHGHTYRLIVEIEGDITKKGWVIDFKKLKSIVNERVIEKLDHSHLNDTIALPTAENIVLWIKKQIEKDFPEDVKLNKIILWETPTSYAKIENK